MRTAKVAICTLSLTNEHKVKSPDYCDCRRVFVLFFLFMREHLSVVPICRVTKRSPCFLLRVVDATFLSVPGFKVVKII